MPELPEVETIRLQLEKVIVGLKISDIEVLREKNWIGKKEEVIGQLVTGVKRRAKVQFIELENGLNLAVHLKMTGQLIWREPNHESRIKKKELCEGKKNVYDADVLPNKYTRVIIHFDNGGILYFNDLRVFGWIRVVKDNDKDQEIKEKFGPEAIDGETFTEEYFKAMLGKTNRPVKLVILDQSKLAGVGNIYANEALYRAGIDPRKPAKKLRNKEIKKLREEIIKVLREAIKYCGTSDKDEAFRQLDGEKGGFQKYLQVYNREGKPCLKCGGVVKKIKIGGRGTYFCPKCQI